MSATNTTFTAYIFQEDYDRLTRQEVTHANQQQKGGSLFGQWTSTGNPVIHRVMSFGHSQSSCEAVAKELHEGFRVCYIGEWRPVQYHTYNDMRAREAREEREAREARERLRGREAPARFLVLDVSRADVVPFLLNRQTARQESGKLERLPGKNPFNKRESFQEAMPRRDYHDPLRYPLVQPGQPNLSHQVPPAAQPQFQEATTTFSQWYSGEDGTKKLQKVVEDLNEIAVGNVDMSRDTKTQDISLSFTDKRRGKKWEIRFPPRFPSAGALLVLSPGTRQEYQQRQATSDKASKAVKNMISTIQTGII